MTADRSDADEIERVRAVEDLAVLVEASQAELDDIAKLAAGIAGVGSAAINLIDATHQHQIAAEGIERSSQIREATMCDTSIRYQDPIYLPDAREDPRYANNPWVNGELGSIRFYNASQLRNRDGYIVGTLCVFDDSVHTLDDRQRSVLDDLADRVGAWLDSHQRQSDLERAVGELQRSNADLASFTGRVAHDMRNPLTAITGFLTLAERRFGDEMSEQLATIIHTALESAQRMAVLIEDMLAFATVGGEPLMAEVELSDVAADVATDTATVLHAAGATIDLRPLPKVITDATLVRALLLNLVGNAVKFTRAGVPPLIVLSGGYADDGGWSISVADNGRGIPEIDRIRIFEPFVRASNSAGAQGTGIGLATCARIAERLRGRLDVTETPGGGATFTLKIPSLPADPTEA